MLEELPSWTWDVLDSEWHKGYLHLTNYLKEHGDARPPSTFITPSGFRLGSWLQTLRDKKKAGSLRNEYFELLNSLSGIQWDVLSEAWDEAYQCLKSYAVRTYTMDYLFETGIIDKIDFLKIDIEGAEHQVFRGMSNENLGKIKS